MVDVTHKCGSTQIAYVRDSSPDPTEDAQQWRESWGMKTSGDYICEIRFQVVVQSGSGECFDDLALDPGGAVPSLSVWGLASLAMVLLVFGVLGTRRLRHSSADEF
ncbi:MAG TPA: hypothetical protein VHF47_14175 [Acidimicrobiales bacterium]|nr:hypothetical protein [Acidimicrobiales bacterium]